MEIEITAGVWGAVAMCGFVVWLIAVLVYLHGMSLTLHRIDRNINGIKGINSATSITTSEILEVVKKLHD
jgi:hypothetical protein